jgi:hypothetical protein
MTKLLQSCHRAIVSNFVGLAPWIAAGGHQFGSLWTRDFCFAVGGLAASGVDEFRRVTLLQLRELLRWVRSDGLSPRLLDDGSASWRVIKYTVFRGLHWNQPRAPMSSPLRPQYLGEHGTPARDSGPLLVWALLRNCDLKELKDLTPLERSSLSAILKKELIDSGNLRRWIHQPAFSDWQDSKRREGATLYLNTMSLWALDLASELSIQWLWKDESPWHLDSREDLIAKIRGRALALWPDPAVLPSSMLDPSKDPSVSLDGPLLWLEAAFERGWLDMDGLHSRYQCLRSHSLWTRDPLPGRVTDRPSNRSETAWTTQAVGLTQYHGELWWWWLAALAARVASQQGDEKEAHRILGGLENLIDLGHEPFEIGSWREQNLTPFTGLLYRSEQPFTWAAAQTLETLSRLRLRPLDPATTPVI